MGSLRPYLGYRRRSLPEDGVQQDPMVVDLEKHAGVAEPGHGQFVRCSKVWLLHGDAQLRSWSNSVCRPHHAKGNPCETAENVRGLAAVKRSVTELGRIPAVALLLIMVPRSNEDTATLGRLMDAHTGTVPRPNDARAPTPNLRIRSEE